MPPATITHKRLFDSVGLDSRIFTHQYDIRTTVRVSAKFKKIFHSKKIANIFCYSGGQNKLIREL